MSEHDVEMRAMFRTLADEARLPAEAERRLLSAARRRRKLTAGVATLSLFVAIGGIGMTSVLWNPADAPSRGTRIGAPGEQQGVRLHFDESSGECIGDQVALLNECKAELSRVLSALRNAATAQESFATTTTDASYTNRLSDLADQGFQEPADLDMKVFGPSVGDAFYCIEAFSKQLRGTLHFSSMVGSPEPGPCFAELESILKNAATAEESYATVRPGRYTDDLSKLEEEGLELREGIELTVTVGGDQYCIEAVSVDEDATLHYSSTTGRPKPGPCPRGGS